jgi:hypothetical protein
VEGYVRINYAILISCAVLSTALAAHAADPPTAGLEKVEVPKVNDLTRIDVTAASGGCGLPFRIQGTVHTEAALKFGKVEIGLQKKTRTMPIPEPLPAGGTLNFVDGNVDPLDCSAPLGKLTLKLVSPAGTTLWTRSFPPVSWTGAGTFTASSERVFMKHVSIAGTCSTMVGSFNFTFSNPKSAQAVVPFEATFGSEPFRVAEVTVPGMQDLQKQYTMHVDCENVATPQLKWKLFGTNGPGGTVSASNVSFL